jgi:Big-like domain-containing protein
MAVLCTASIWWLAAGAARADTPPSNTGALPSISGVPQEGDVLTASPGEWSGDAPITFSYVWSNGLTGNSITLASTDVGQSLTVTVTATNDFGQASATSGSDGPVLPAAPTPGNPPPVISGTPVQQGNTLSVSTGTWNNNPSGFGYVWEDCDGSGNNCTAITGANSSTYTLKAADVGGTIVAQVTASNAGGQNSATSAAVGPVLPLAPTIGAAKPAISGTPVQQGNTLSVSTGTWNNDPTGFAYLWEDCNSSGTNCSPIAGATSSTYTLQSSDVGHKVLSQVTASNAGGQNSASSAAVGPVLPAAPTIGTAPGITGTAQQGQSLTVSNGTWGNNPTKFAYAWQDCDSSGNNCSSIATGSNTYTLQGTDVHRFVSVTVTASNSGGSTPVTTASVGPVLPPPPANTGSPSISMSGGTLTVSPGSWSNNPTGFSYAWESCDTSGANCTPIAGATSSSYALSAADIGATIVCVVTATGEGGSGSAPSAKTAVVRASDIPPASQPTATDLLATPSAAVTNQSVTLIATVTAGTSSTALWGTITFENGGAAIGGCATLPAVPSGRSATVACSTSFPASNAQLSAVFTPASGSILKGSSSPGTSLAVGPDTSSTTLSASSSVSVGASTTYTAAVAPGPHSGPVQPTGSVAFLDGSTPIDSCASQPLSGGVASCTVSYAAPGTHQITARYSGDANFNGSSSPASQVSAESAPTSVLGTVTATMQWAFYFTPKYTLVRNLVVNGVAPGAKVVVRCQGHGCPFATRATVLTNGKRCGRKAKRSCLPPGTLNLTNSFTGRHLAVGARVTVSIIRPGWVGKSYRFTVRARRGPRVQIGSLPVA